MYRGGSSPMAGKVALITGSSSGIGQATAVELGRRGCLLSVTGRSEPKLADTIKLCVEAGLNENQVLTTVADVTKSEDLKNLVDRTVEKFNKIDILVANAGIGVLSDTINTPVEVYDRITNTNLRSVIILDQLCLEHLKKSKGCIINIGSVASLIPNKASLYYGMSKVSLDYLTKSLALELGPSGVRVNSVNPAFIDTPVFCTMGLGAEQKEQMLETMGPLHPLGRVGQPSEVAKAVAFLASDDASFTTGHIFVTDGGMATGTNQPSQ